MTQSEAIDRLRDRASRDFPQPWVAENPDDEIAGELLRYERGNTRSYGEKWIAVLRTPEGEERSVWLLHTVLNNQFARLKPKVGELVLIRYQGKREGAGGSTYDDYRVEIDRGEDMAPDWSELGADGDGDVTADVRAAASADIPLHEPLGEAESDQAGVDIPF